LQRVRDPFDLCRVHETALHRHARRRQLHIKTGKVVGRHEDRFVQVLAHLVVRDGEGCDDVDRIDAEP
jgi:hypothetical protein